MKIIKYLAITFAAILILILVIALFVPNEMVYEKSININAPIETVWENTNSLSAMDKWSPWNAKDPEMVKEYAGVDGTVGSSQSWDSPVDEVGKGTQTVTKIEAPTLFETELAFVRPFESVAMGYVYLKVEANTTKATWGFKSEMPYPVNISILFMDLEKDMGDDWRKALNALKTMSEKDFELQSMEQ